MSLATAAAVRNDDPRLDQLFSALASQPRRDIVDHLASGPATTPQIGRRFDFSKQALNRHVVALEEAGLIRRSLEGRVHHLSLVPDQLNGVAQWADQVRRAWSANLDRLGNVLAEQGPDDVET